VVLGLLTRKLGWKLDDSNLWVITWAILIGAGFIFFVESKVKDFKPTEYISWRGALIIGAAQVVAGVFPGTSRSAATILSAMLLGTSRFAATEFSFLLGIPTMLAATGYVLLEQVKKNGMPPHHEMGHFILGFIVSTIVAFIVVKWLLSYIRTHTFTPFAWYRLILGVGMISWLVWG
jgi:undecaprenyl-diphosphatase